MNSTAISGTPRTISITPMQTRLDGGQVRLAPERQQDGERQSADHRADEQDQGQRQAAPIMRADRRQAE